MDHTEQIADSLLFRRATRDDIPAITAILKAAAARMLAEGKQQWDESYPTEAHVCADIDRQAGYVMSRDGKAVAYAAVIFDGEPAYGNISGKWLSEGRYVVVHRMAVSQDLQRKGIARMLMKAVEDYARNAGVCSFKVDTNYDNFAMLGMLRALGFTYCGEIEYQRGTRKAFEKLI